MPYKRTFLGYKEGLYQTKQQFPCVAGTLGIANRGRSSKGKLIILALFVTFVTPDMGWKSILVWGTVFR